MAEADGSSPKGKGPQPSARLRSTQLRSAKLRSDLTHSAQLRCNPPGSETLGAETLRSDTLRGAEGFFRAGQDDAGRWWLLDARGAPCFARCVHGVDNAAPAAVGKAPWAAAARLRAWGFNAVGLGVDGAGSDDGLPFMAGVDFCRAGRLLAAPGVRLPDVFDPDWPQRAAARAQDMCAPLSECRELIGWVSDVGLGWGPPAQRDRPSLLQICLSLEPSCGAYHAAWEFVLALHGGRLEALARAWGAVLPNKAVVREMTRTEQGLATRGYLRDAARWTREFARRYFSATAAAIRAADPNHLVLGCRFEAVPDADVWAECVYPMVDVGLAHWSALPPPGMKPLQPVLASEVSWVGEEFGQAPAGRRIRRLTTLERMLRRARATLERMARHPAVVGYAWAQWQDEPGEQPPFARGLVHVNGAEAREHTEVLSQFNARAESLRRAASAPGMRPAKNQSKRAPAAAAPAPPDRFGGAAEV